MQRFLTRLLSILVNPERNAIQVRSGAGCGFWDWFSFGLRLAHSLEQTRIQATGPTLATLRV